MCGLAGILTSHGLRDEELRPLAADMAARLAHRGPDDAGVWCDAPAGVALGFRRLAVIDPSPRGRQPMTSASGRWVVVYNGEIYNHRAVRKELEGHGVGFRGRSDTEVLVEAVDHWGIEGALRRFVGMFAFAAWDRRTRTLSLARDRLGVKPMFVLSRPGAIAFASELKAFAALPFFSPEVDRDAVASYLRYLYVPGPRSIYEGVRKLPPGHILTVADVARPLPGSVAYWSLGEVARAGLAEPFAGSADEAVTELESLLADSVALRLESDVPLGAFLSGGVDSSVVVALMSEGGSGTVRTFSVSFEDALHDEAGHAARVAGFLGTDHTEFTVTGEDALAVAPRLAEMFDEPLADTSQIPLHLLCQHARRDVTVALSGDGGDEVFGGYHRFLYGHRMLRVARRLPSPVRAAVGAAASRVPAGVVDRAQHSLGGLGAVAGGRLLGTKLRKLGRAMDAGSLDGMYRSLLSSWPLSDVLVRGGAPVPGAVEELLGDGGSVLNGRGELVDRMMLADQIEYLVDDQLAKVDRVSMSSSLEVRVPLLDHRVVEFAWRLPARLRVGSGRGKRVLREVLHRQVPRRLVDRPKTGLSVPLGAWLRGPLREWSEDLLEPRELGRDDLLHAPPIRRAWEEVRHGRDERALGVWAVLVLQAWRRRWAR